MIDKDLVDLLTDYIAVLQQRLDGYSNRVTVEDSCQCKSACQQQDTDSLEQRVRDLECEVESLFAFQRRDHPATRPMEAANVSIGNTPTFDNSGYLLRSNSPDARLHFTPASCVSGCGIRVGTDEKGNGVSGGTYKPAPVASEVTSELFVQHIYGYNDHKYYRPATPAQVRAEYERLFPAEVKRAKVAEALLTEALRNPAGYERDMLHESDIMKQIGFTLIEGGYANAASLLARMAAALESAAKRRCRSECEDYPASTLYSRSYHGVSGKISRSNYTPCD